MNQFSAPFARAAMAGLGLAAVLAASPLHAAGTASDGANVPEREWRFRVFVDDREVGYHHFQLEEQGGRQVMRSNADFEYRLMFLTLYRYEHENREEWDGNCLSRIESRTDANGKPYAVAGERRDDGFMVRGEKGADVLPECVMSFAYWNPAFLDAGKLLNSQNGEYLDVRVSGPFPEEFEAGGAKRQAERFRLEAGKLELELWYSEQRDWLGLRTRYQNGRTLRYELVTDPQVATHDAAGGLPDDMQAGNVASL